MNGAIRWMADNHVAANLLMLLFLIGGLFFGTQIKQEVFPEILLDTIQITVSYPGASPDEVERGILLVVEEAISGVDGIKEISSQASEGSGTVSAEISAGEDADLILQEIKSEVDRITTFPQDAEKPVVSKLLNRREVISLVVYGDAPERTLREQAEMLRDELLSKESITQADLIGVRPYEISIEIPEETLERHGLTLEEVAGRIRKASLDLPGGSIKTKGSEITLRVKEKKYLGMGYQDIPILSRADGSIIRLKEIARIIDGFADTDTTAVFDGLPAAMVRVYRVGDQKPTELSQIVRDFVREKQAGLPSSLQLATWNDSSEVFQSRLDLLRKNAVFGLILVFVVLSLFLQMRLALWVMLGIPVSFLGSMVIMPFFDVSINMISLFAFIMALGIVVDDAIVVGENIFSHRETAVSPAEASIAGTREVASPVTFSVLTSIAAFVPLIFVEGLLGKFIKVIPMVVISILIVSLIESLFILPAHISSMKITRKKTHRPNMFQRFRLVFGNGLQNIVAGPYSRTLSVCLRYRYITVAAALALLLVTVGLVRGNVIKFLFMPDVDGDVILVDLRMPPGTPVSVTQKNMDHILAKGEETFAEVDRNLQSAGSVRRNIYAVTGASLGQGGPMGGSGAAAPHLGSIALFLMPSETRGIAAEEISAAWRKKVGEIPGADSLAFTSNMVHIGDDIDIRLAHPDIAVLTKAAGQLKEHLARYPGVRDIKDNLPPGKIEYTFQLTDLAKNAGITDEELARQVRAAFYGAEALRLQRGRNEVKVMVRYPEEQRNRVAVLDSMRLRTQAGGAVFLQDAARIQEGRSYSQIQRNNRKRVINVTAGVDSRKGNAQEILTDLRDTVLHKFTADYRGLVFSMEGKSKERRESMQSMLRGFLLALLVIYTLLAVPLKSYSQPFIIMSAIPFSIVGAVLGHLVLGLNLTILSIFGMVALTGVVVNDSLLLMDKCNQMLQNGAGVFDAAHMAGQKRFRAIILTSLTTFFGLIPIISETSVQAQFLIPMAVSLAFGVLFATLITLIFVPALFLVLQDCRTLLGMK